MSLVRFSRLSTTTFIDILLVVVMMWILPEVELKKTMRVFSLQHYVKRHQICTIYNTFLWWLWRNDKPIDLLEIDSKYQKTFKITALTASTWNCVPNVYVCICVYYKWHTTNCRFSRISSESAFSMQWKNLMAFDTYTDTNNLYIKHTRT